MDGAGALLATLLAYKLVLLGIGFWAARRTRSGEDFYLGGRALGPWVASISSAASSSSAWSLLGVSGAAWKWGLSAAWLLPACLCGFALNWWVVAGPLRRISAATGSTTLVGLLAAEVEPRWKRPLTMLAAGIVLLSLGVYVASQFKAAGLTFAASLDMSPTPAILVGSALVLFYTMVGGFWAVSVTDLLQGLVMAAAAIVVPVAALMACGGWEGMIAGLAKVRPDLLDWGRGKSGPALIGFVVGTFGIGLGYPGQPHVVNRFMAMRSESDIRKGAWISMVWALVLYSGMLLAGWCARALGHVPTDHEGVLLVLTRGLFPAAVAGVIVAAVLSAIMSTADSQLLVCGSTVAHDLPKKDRLRPRRGLALDRVSVFLIGILAVWAAMSLEQTIFDSVLFAWSALGASLGPLLLVRILRGPVAGPWAIASMFLGFAVTLIWFFTPALKAQIYELVPAFSAALIPAWFGVRRPVG